MFEFDNMEYRITFDKKQGKWIAEERHTKDNITYYGRGASPIKALEAIQEAHAIFLEQYFEKK